MTVREHLEQAIAFDPGAMALLVGPPLPPIAEHAWRVFEDLHSARAMTMQGLTPIAYSELDAYRRLTATPLTPLDVHLVRVIDEVCVQEIARAMTPDTPDDAGLPDLPTEP